MQFKDIIGQESVKNRLRQAVAESRVPHAQLLSGPAGVGKLRLAIAYAQYIACEHRTAEDSCGVCPTCLQYTKLQHPDLNFAFPIVKTDAGDTCDDFMPRFRELLLSDRYFDLDDWYRTLGVETKQGMIYEKESSEILRKLSLKAFSNGYKVMIIWQADKMNAQCANKLLKLLEEPPEKTLFLLVTEHPELLLPTIISRVQPVNVPRLEEETLVNGLLTEHSAMSRTDAADIAHIANGSWLTAVRLADEDEQNRSFFDDFVALMRNAYTIGQIRDPQRKFEALRTLREWSLRMADAKVGRERQKAFLQYAQRQVRENYVFNLTHSAPSEHTPDQLARLNYQTADERRFSERFAPYIHDGNIDAIVEQLDRAEQQITQNGNAKMIFFDLCLQLIVLIKR